jgi:hypothetical protein
MMKLSPHASILSADAGTEARGGDSLTRNHFEFFTKSRACPAVLQSGPHCNAFRGLRLGPSPSGATRWIECRPDGAGARAEDSQRRLLRAGRRQRAEKLDMNDDKASAIPILAPQSIRRRRRLSLIGFLLGLGAVILSLVVVAISQLRHREEIEQDYLRRTRAELSLLCSALDDPHEKDKDDEVLLNVLCDRWRQMDHWGHDPDEHFIVVNNVDSEVLLDTIYQGWLHHPEKSMGLRLVISSVCLARYWSCAASRCRCRSC